MTDDLRDWVTKQAGPEFVPSFTPSLAAADRAMKLTPEERALYQRHLTNLSGPGGVYNEDGSRSTLFQASVDHDGKTYNIPTVWDGKILPIDQAIDRVRAEGWDKFPSYQTAEDAEARYQKMHVFMEKDTDAFRRGGNFRSIEMGGFAGAERNWSVAGMIADGQTEAEIKAGRPPSYHVAIKRKDGMLEIMPGRVAFDPGDRVMAHGEELDRRRGILESLRTNPFNNAMPQP